MANTNTKSSVVKVTNIFEDDVKTTVNISDVNTDSIVTTDIVNKVKAFNADNSEYANLMLSKYGNKWKGITAVSITTTARNYIF